MFWIIYAIILVLWHRPRVVVVVGKKASGKSYFSKRLAKWLSFLGYPAAHLEVDRMIDEAIAENSLQGKKLHYKTYTDDNCITHKPLQEKVQEFASQPQMPVFDGAFRVGPCQKIFGDATPLIFYIRHVTFWGYVKAILQRTKRDIETNEKSLGNDWPKMEKEVGPDKTKYFSDPETHKKLRKYVATATGRRMEESYQNLRDFHDAGVYPWRIWTWLT